MIKVLKNEVGLKEQQSSQWTLTGCFRKAYILHKLYGDCENYWCGRTGGWIGNVREDGGSNELETNTRQKKTKKGVGAYMCILNVWLH